MNSKTVFTTAEKMIVKFFPAVYHFVQERVVPRVESLINDDVKLEKALKLAFRFMPFPLRMITSEEKFAAFIIARKVQFFGRGGSDVATTSAV